MNTNERQAYDVPTFCQLFSIGKTRTYQEIKEGRLKIVKVGKRTLIPAQSATEWLANLNTVEVAGHDR